MSTTFHRHVKAGRKTGEMKRVFAFLLLSSMLMLSVFIYTVTYILQFIVKMIGKIIDGLFGRLDKVNEYSVNSIDSPGE